MSAAWVLQNLFVISKLLMAKCHIHLEKKILFLSEVQNVYKETMLPKAYSWVLTNTWLNIHLAGCDIFRCPLVEHMCAHTKK